MVKGEEKEELKEKETSFSFSLRHPGAKVQLLDSSDHVICQVELLGPEGGKFDRVCLLM